MSTNNVDFSVFTKSWKLPIPELGRHIKALGFDGIELPVRPGFQVTPENMAGELPRAAAQLAEAGVKIFSLATEPTPAAIAACGDAGIPVIRICVSIEEDGYMATEAKVQRKFDDLVPALEKHHVTIGVQNHCDACVASAMGMRHLIEKYDPRHVGAVWDAAHSALNGEDPELGLDICWSHLCMVNLKNAFWRRASGPEAEDVVWKHYFTTGRQGVSSWPRIAAELKRRKYEGVVCLTAEYTDGEAVDRLTAEDIAFAKSLFVEK